MVGSPSRVWSTGPSAPGCRWACSTGPAQLFSAVSMKMAPSADVRAWESCGARFSTAAGGVGQPSSVSPANCPLSPHDVTAVSPGEGASWAWSQIL
jgi:hypothetical protein